MHSASRLRAQLPLVTPRYRLLSLALLAAPVPVP